MRMKLNYRIAILLFAAIFGLAYSIPSLTQSDEGKKITLGLDLQGGLNMILGVKSEEAVKSHLKSIASGVKHFADRNEIFLEHISINEDEVSFELLDIDDIEAMDKHLKTLDGIYIDKEALSYIVKMTPESIISLEQLAIDQAVETIRNRLDQFGLAEPSVTKQGIDKIQVELPGIKTQEEENRARELISRAAKLELMAVDEERAMRVYEMTPLEAASYGDAILEDAKNPQIKYLVNSIPILDGSMLTDASMGYDQNNNPVIHFSLNSVGAQIFGDFTGKNVGKRLAIVLDNKVYSAPNINERIGGGSGQISGSYTKEEANDLAIALRSGALLAPIYMMEKRSVGPSLGADSIKASMVALVSGFVLVALFMILYYSLAGVVAVIALVVNLLLIIAVMAMFGATLTLPGMAGIVLTIGMAVDANVIISERIREFLRAGHSLKKALDLGYDNAIRAILDSNITTLIAAVLLYSYGTGSIKGFAITMSIGIIASMLTAILGTYGIYQMLEKWMSKSKKPARFFGIKV